MILGAVAGVLVLSGCTGDGNAPAAAPSPTAPVAGAGCPNMAASAGGRQLRFGVGGATNLAGIVAGKGTTGIVLAHEFGADVCQWILEFNELIGKGYRVLAFDSHGFGASGDSPANFDDDVVAAAAALRADGATKVVLMGASMGGTFSLSAATKVAPPVAAVISSSGPALYGGVDAAAAVPEIAVPVLFVAQEDDGLFGQAATQMHAVAKASPDAQIKVTPGTTHGYRLVSPGGDEAIRRVLYAFLAKYAPPA
jgi:pimeloyl-ACP methyl ester carboxylesterase